MSEGILTRRDFGKALSAGFAPLLFQSPSMPTRRYTYLHLDVFTDRPFEGNQLLVFLQPDGLSADAMQTLTRESNLSECTFVFPPDRAGTDYRVRIFMRNNEAPFAGHPTIGTAFALAHAGVIKPGTPRSVFGLGIGPTPIDLEWEGARLRFAWMTQLKPTFGKTVTDSAALAAALGLDPSAIAAQRAPAQEVGCGSTFLIVPIATRAAVDAAALDRARINQVFAAAGMQQRGVYIFTSETAGDRADAYTRLLGTGGIEDPATGSAAGPAGCFIVRHGFAPAEKAGHLEFLQGVLVRRPSRLHINIGSTAGEITLVKVGGAAVVVGEGSVQV